MFIFSVPFSNRQHSKFVPNVSDLCKKLTKLRKIVKNFLIIFQLFSFKRWNFFQILGQSFFFRGNNSPLMGLLWAKMWAVKIVLFRGGRKVAGSVTGFSSVFQLRQFLHGLNSNWQNYESTLAIFSMVYLVFGKFFKLLWQF